MPEDGSPDTLLVAPADVALNELCQQRRIAHQYLISSRRQGVIRELRGLSLAPELCSALRPNELYRLSLPDGAVLQKGKDGLFSGVLRNKKGIEAHAKFVRVKGNALSLAKVVGTQVMLVSIAIQLNRIERLVESVVGALHQDRLAEVQAGLVSANEALLIQDAVTRNQSLVNAIQTLNLGIQKNYLEMKCGIEALPAPELRFRDNWISRKSAGIAKKLSPLQETLYCYLEGLSAVAECYSALNEPMAAAASIRHRIQQLSDLDPARVARIAQVVPAQPGRCTPEGPWRCVVETLPRLGEIATAIENASKPDRKVYLEITGNELMEAANDQV